MMNATAATNDNFIEGTDTIEQDVIANAIMVATAFRLRDEEALVTVLRRLTSSVARLEAAIEA